MGEKVWLELNIYPDIDRIGNGGYFDNKVTWQWRGGRCVSNGTAVDLDDAIENAWEAYFRFEEISEQG